MSAPVQDQQTVTPQGEQTQALPHGVTFHDVVTHVDDRGTVCELFDPRWGWHPDPLVFAYSFTIRPGMIKGWGMHRKHEDRYFILQGEMDVVLYDERPDSPTYGLVAKIVMSEYRRRLMNIPAGVHQVLDQRIAQSDELMLELIKRTEAGEVETAKLIESFAQMEKLSEIRTEIEHVHASFGWRLVHGLRALKGRTLPPGTRREHAWLRIQKKLLR